jgi:hypothetical protein
VFEQLLRALAIQLSQGQGRQPRRREGAPRATGGWLPRAVRALWCGRGIIRAPAAGVKAIIGRNLVQHFHIALDHGRQVIIRP